MRGYYVVMNDIGEFYTHTLFFRGGKRAVFSMTGAAIFNSPALAEDCLEMLGNDRLCIGQITPVMTGRVHCKNTIVASSN